MGKYYIQSKTHVTESNDKLYMLEFAFDSDKDAIMIANWRGHPIVNDLLEVDADGNVLENPENIFYYNYAARSGNAGYTVQTKSDYISGDYVNAFRCLMKEKGYDVSFIQGAGGNLESVNNALQNPVQMIQSRCTVAP